MTTDKRTTFPKQEEDDINDIFDSIALSEDKLVSEGFQEGYSEGVLSGRIEGFHLGYHRGVEVGLEIGFYEGVVKVWLEYSLNKDGALSEKELKTLYKVSELISQYPHVNDPDVDIIKLRDSIRAQFKKLCSLLKLDLSLPSTSQYSF